VPAPVGSIRLLNLVLARSVNYRNPLSQDLTRMPGDSIYNASKSTCRGEALDSPFGAIRRLRFLHV